MNPIGIPLDRVHGPDKVTGLAQFAGDFHAQGLLYGHIVESTVARGRIAAIDVARAEGAPGVHAILTHHNALRLNPVRTWEQGGHAGQSALPLQGTEISYPGEPVALVVAETLESAQAAGRLISVQYEEAAPVATIDQGLSDAFDLPREGVTRGDVAAGLAGADVHFEATYRTPIEHNNPMEPHAAAAAWHDGRLVVHDSTQGVFGVQDTLAAAFGIERDAVTVFCLYLGGGFGCKGRVWAHVLLAAMAARQLGRPVHVEFTRSQMFVSNGFRPTTIQRITLGARSDGALTALRHDVTSQTSQHDDYVESASHVSARWYAYPNLLTSQRLVRVNTVTPTIMRAPGECPGSFALECALDELAWELEMDPIELRLRNYSEVNPLNGKPWSSKHLRECYEQGAARFGWERRSPRPATTHNGQFLVGMGMATSAYPVNRNSASARAILRADGTVTVESGTQELGTGTYTVMTQVAAAALGLEPDTVEFCLGSTQFPKAPTSGGSSTVNSVAPVVYEACFRLRERAIRMACDDPASSLHGCDPARVRVENGRMISDDGRRSETYSNLMRRHGLDRMEEEAHSTAGHEDVAMHAWGAHFAEVQVDPDLCEVRVSRWVAVYDAGRILNPKMARSQLIGGIVFGIGMALLERTDPDPRTARFVNADLEHYLLPVNADVPDMDIHILPGVDDAVNVLGTKGIGEIGAVGSAAAIANAVYHATGKRVRELPITISKLL